MIVRRGYICNYEPLKQVLVLFYAYGPWASFNPLNTSNVALLS